MKPTVRHIDEVSEGWLSEALGVPVRSVRAEPIGTGQTSATFRLAIDSDACPSSLVIKFAAGDDAACRRVATAHRSEVGFYKSLAASIDVRTPSCWYGSIDEDGSRFTLVVEDLAPWRPGRQIDGCNLTQATAAVRYLAALHASRWNDSSLHDVDFLIPVTGERAAYLGELARGATDSFIDRYRSRLDADDNATLREVAGKLVEWQLCRERPFAMVHGDFRPDNLLFSPDGCGRRRHRLADIDGYAPRPRSLLLRGDGARTRATPCSRAGSGGRLPPGVGRPRRRGVLPRAVLRRLQNRSTPGSDDHRARLHDVGRGSRSGDRRDVPDHGRALVRRHQRARLSRRTSVLTTRVEDLRTR